MDMRLIERYAIVLKVEIYKMGIDKSLDAYISGAPRVPNRPNNSYTCASYLAAIWAYKLVENNTYYELRVDWLYRVADE